MPRAIKADISLSIKLVCESGRTLIGTTQCRLSPRRESPRRNVCFLCRVHARRRKERMQILYSRCCGIGVHKNSVTACVLVYASDKEPEVRQKEFPTHFKALGNLRLWLLSQKVTHVALKSTGVYWKPVWQALEGHFELILANPFQVKTMPGKKTDAADSHWLAELLAHGLIKPSFVPPRATRELRDLTRYRVKLTEERN